VGKIEGIKPNNFDRLLALAEEVFDMRSDPEQLDVNPEVREKMMALHPACLNEFKNEDGPLIWLLAFPTTKELADRFIAGEISEKQLFDLTPLNVPYHSIYLCSALALPEARGTGKVTALALAAIEQMRNDHAIEELLVWPFTKEGDGLAEKLKARTGLNMRMRRR